MSFGRAEGIKQGDGEARRGRGWALRDRNRCREALESFGEAARRDPGNALAGLGRRGEALAALDEALRRDPEDEAAADTVQVVIPAAVRRPAGREPAALVAAGSIVMR